MVLQGQRQRCEGETAMSGHTLGWREWFPGLENDHETLGSVLETLPAAPPSAIPWIVRLLENPTGWFCLHGAVDLAVHDRIHVLLGRGLLAQDEAFVIGFTMGSTRAVLCLEQLVFKFSVAYLYPDPYRIPWSILAAYDLGLEAGQRLGIKNVHCAITDDMLSWKLGMVRSVLGIDTARLREFYEREQAMLPSTAASQRLLSARCFRQSASGVRGGNHMTTN